MVNEWVIKEGIPGILDQIYKSTGGVNIYWRCQQLVWLGKNGGSNKKGVGEIYKNFHLII